MAIISATTWVLTESIKQTLLVFERKILRKIFGPTKERDGTWRIKTNNELNKLIKNKTIINYIKSQKLGWFGHVCRMPDKRVVKKGVGMVTHGNKIIRKAQK